MAKDHTKNKEELEEKDPPEDTEADAPQAAEEETPAPKNKPYIRLWQWLLANKKASLPLGLVLLLAILAAIPFTRYAIAGLVIQKPFSIRVIDADTNKPVTSAMVRLAGKQTVTDNKGQATIRANVGQAKLEISKKYYQTASREVLVPFKRSTQLTEVKLKATGRAVPVTVLSKIDKKPLANVVLKVEGTEAKTDTEGAAIIVVSPNQKRLKVTLGREGFNSREATLEVTSEEVAANTFELTPSGKVYFLSNQSGKLDVVKSDLDGQNRQTVVAGTGKEAKGETVLLATRDWKYLALYSKRDGGEYAKLFLIDTSNDSIKIIDEGEATFVLSGWDDHRFIYRVDRQKVQRWQPKKQALKSYDADSKKLTTLDEVGAEGDQASYAYEFYGNVYIIDHAVLYTKGWSSNYYNGMQGKQATLNSVAPGGGNKKVIKSFAPSGQVSYLSVESRPYGVDELYLRTYLGGEKASYFEFEDGKVKDAPDITEDTYYNSTYATYLESPSGKQTFWNEDRDGKQALFIGDEKGKNEKRIATFDDEYQTYGWFSDSYLLVSKKGSELFIMSASGVDAEAKLLKVTDYYRPLYTYRGYGGGYGGL